MVESGRGWIALATRRDVVLRALRVAAVVGTILITIHYGDRLLAAEVGPRELWKMGLTYFVPYAVATYSAVQALRAPSRFAESEATP